MVKGFFLKIFSCFFALLIFFSSIHIFVFCVPFFFFTVYLFFIIINISLTFIIIIFPRHYNPSISLCSKSIITFSHPNHHYIPLSPPNNQLFISNIHSPIVFLSYILLFPRCFHHCLCRSLQCPSLRQPSTHRLKSLVL